jgi:hypothetical protein
MMTSCNDMWGRLKTCGRLAIGLAGACTRRLHGFGLGSLPGSKTLRCLFAFPGRPIDNRPQVGNLPHL